MKSCAQCKKDFEITDSDRDFYRKMDVPEPAECAACRSQQRMCFRNERTLYSCLCSLCKKNIISMYSSNVPFPVYCAECFWSDRWDAEAFGRLIDTQAPFFPQLKALSDTTPRLGIVNKNSVNSEFCNYSLQNKNCYLTFGSHREEDCMYGHYSTHNRNQLDYLWTYENELCYECSFTTHSYRSVGLRHCEKCTECFFSSDLKDCFHCLFSSGLRHKEYYIFNKPYSKEEYEQKFAEYRLDTASGFVRAYEIFRTDVLGRFPIRASYQVTCEHCEGTNLQNCKNCTQCFNASHCENVAYGYQMDWVLDSQDQNYMGYDRSELCYQTIGCTGVFRCRFCDSCWTNSDLTYCAYCFSSQDCFGCISLNKKKYCILNTSYEKEEYGRLVGEIQKTMIKTGEWGRFFPKEYSPFGYNESVASESYPLEEDDALALQYRWNDELPFTTGKQTFSWGNIPDAIHDVDVTSMDGSIASCTTCKRNYKFVKKELEFYGALSLPLPRLCPQCRYLRRLDNEKSFTLYRRMCTCTNGNHSFHTGSSCGEILSTTYSPDRPELVYCEACYQKEVV